MEAKKQSHHREIFLAVLLTAAIVVGSVVLSRFPFLRFGEGLEGKQAPEINYVDFDSKPTKLSEKRGSVILLYFWAVWFGDCLNELPLLAQLEDHFKSKGFVLLAFDIGGRGETIRGKISGKTLPRNLIFHFSKENLGPYKIKGLPLGVLIDDRGDVRRAFSGPTKWMDLKTIREIQDLLH